MKISQEVESLKVITGRDIEKSSRVTGIDISKSSSGGVFKTKLQSEILQNFKEVTFLDQNYRQGYCKILKKWNF